MVTADRPLGRYALLAEIARGGMATVHVGRLVGPGGFGRTVAIKRLHTHLAEDEEFVSMLLDEARLAGRIQHPNVVGMLDVVTNDKEVLLVMEYVDGESLYKLLREAKKREKRIPANIASAILIDSLRGLGAAHEAKNERGEPLDIVHRDFTPQNIMVRRDGTSLVVDFGIAKAVGRLHTTEEGKIKGKLPYMAPEQVRGEKLDRRVDVYAAGAVLWEALVGDRAVRGTTEAEVLERLLYGTIEAPSQRVADIPPAADEVVLRALKRDPNERFATASEMQRALENALPPALPSRVADWLAELFGESLSKRAERVAELEREMVEQGSNPRAAATVIERARPIPEPATPPSKREVPAPPADPTSAALAVTTVDNPKRAGRALADAEAAPRRSTLRGALGVGAIAVAMGGSYAAWTAIRAKGSPEAATTSPPSAAPASPPSSVATSNAIEKPVSSAATAPSSTAAPTPSVTSSTKPVLVPPPPVIVKPVRKNCSPVTIDSKGQKVYHPECMGNDP